MKIKIGKYMTRSWGLNYAPSIAKYVDKKNSVKSMRCLPSSLPSFLMWRIFVKNSPTEPEEQKLTANIRFLLSQIDFFTTMRHI